MNYYIKFDETCYRNYICERFEFCDFSHLMFTLLIDTT